MSKTVKMLSKLPGKWLGMLLGPSKTANKERKQGSVYESLLHVTVSGFISALILLAAPPKSMLEIFGPDYWYVILLSTPLLYLLFWALTSAVLYVFARMLGGSAKLVQHSHMIALVYAPFGVLNSIFSVLEGFGSLVLVGSAAVVLYRFYVLTAGLKHTHGYSTDRAAMTWILPILLIFLVAFVLIFFGFFGVLA